MIASGIFDPGEVKCMKDGSLRGKARVARIGTVSMLLMTAVVILTPTVLATNHPYLVGLGQTWIDDFQLDAGVSDGVPPLEIAIVDLDSVTIYYNYTYSDDRVSGDEATHIFTLVVDYGGTFASGKTHKTSILTRPTSDSVSVTVYNVVEDTYIWVNYTASISCDAVPPYYDSDTNMESIYLY